MKVQLAWWRAAACSKRFFGEGEMRHIAPWNSVKYVDEFNEEVKEEAETILSLGTETASQLPLSSR
jgi:hypothetical protein